MPAPSPAPGDNAPEAKEDALPVLDKEGALYLMDDEEIYASFCDEILKSFDRRMDDLRKLARQEDARGLAIKAHSLKGLLEAMGARRSARLALGIEHAARADHLEEALLFACRLERQFDEVRGEYAANN